MKNSTFFRGSNITCSLFVYIYELTQRKCDITFNFIFQFINIVRFIHSWTKKLTIIIIIIGIIIIFVVVVVVDADVVVSSICF